MMADAGFTKYRNQYVLWYRIQRCMLSRRRNARKSGYPGMVCPAAHHRMRKILRKPILNSETGGKGFQKSCDVRKRAENIGEPRK